MTNQTHTTSTLFSTLTTLTPDATLSEVVVALGDTPLPFGVVAAVFSTALDFGISVLKNQLVDLIAQNPGVSLGGLAEMTALPKDRVSSLLTSMLGEENPRIVRTGHKRAAVYSLPGEEISDTQVQDLILSTLATGKPTSRPDLLKSCEDPAISARRVNQNLLALVESSKVLQTGRARGMRFQVPVETSDQPETEIVSM